MQNIQHCNNADHSTRKSIGKPKQKMRVFHSIRVYVWPLFNVIGVFYYFAHCTDCEPIPMHQFIVRVYCLKFRLCEYDQNFLYKFLCGCKISFFDTNIPTIFLHRVFFIISKIICFMFFFVY